MAKNPKRTDIAKEYINNYHDEICQNITNFWDIYNSNMGVKFIIK